MRTWTGAWTGARTGTRVWMGARKGTGTGTGTGYGRGRGYGISSLTDSDSSSQEGETPDNSSEYSSDDRTVESIMMVYGSIAIYVIAGFTLPVLVYQMAISVALNGTAPIFGGYLRRL